MNLLGEAWLPVRRVDNRVERIRVASVVDPDVVGLTSGRPDFDGSLYQFLIALLQTAVAPESESEWRQLYDTPPTADWLMARLKPFHSAFSLSGEGPRFMQDLHLVEGESKPIAGLLIDAPGGNTLKLNQDHFVKRGNVNGACPACAAAALLTLQINAPSGGVGHRTSLRGGGPLSTLLLPDVQAAPLWQQLWLNVLPKGDFAALNRSEIDGDHPEGMFPWLTATHTSENDRKILPLNVHPLQVYWAMPRRIRLNWQTVASGNCDLCGEASDRLLNGYVTKNYGTSYEGWVHPLSPHVDDVKSGLKLPWHGQPGGVGYRHWLGLTLRDVTEKTCRLPAAVLSQKTQSRSRRRLGVRLWAFGYDMDNMKARGWCDAHLPYIETEAAWRSDFEATIKRMVKTAETITSLLREAVKNACYCKVENTDLSRGVKWHTPTGVKSDAGDFEALKAEFWLATESAFYEGLQQLPETFTGDDGEIRREALLVTWHRALCQMAEHLFAKRTATLSTHSVAIKRLVLARSGLTRSIHARKLRLELGLTVPNTQGGKRK